MEQYISKSAIVAEIEKLIDEIYAGRPFDSLSSEQQTALWYVKSIMSSIDTIKVKEVDLEKEMSKYLGDDWKKDADGKIENDMIAFAKHFFELGLKVARKEE